MARMRSRLRSFDDPVTIAVEHDDGSRRWFRGRLRTLSMSIPRYDPLDDDVHRFVSERRIEAAVEMSMRVIDAGGLGDAVHGVGTEEAAERLILATRQSLESRGIPADLLTDEECLALARVAARQAAAGGNVGTAAPATDDR